MASGHQHVDAATTTAAAGGRTGSFDDSTATREEEGFTRQISYTDGDEFVHATTYDNWVSIQTCSKGLLKMHQDAIHLSRQHHDPAIAAAVAQHLAGTAGGSGVGGPPSVTSDPAAHSGVEESDEDDSKASKRRSLEKITIENIDKQKAQVLIYVDRQAAEAEGITFDGPREHGSTVRTMGITTEAASAEGGGTGSETQRRAPLAFVPKRYFQKVVDSKTGVVLWENQELKKRSSVAERVSRIPRIDIHTHILPRNLDLCREFQDPGYIYLDPLPNGDPSRMNMMKTRKTGEPPEHFRQVGRNCFCAVKRAEEMADTGVDVQVLSTVPVMFSYWQSNREKAVRLARYLNDDLALTVAKDPKHFIGLGTVPLQFPDEAVLELRRCMTELKFKGVQIGTHVDLRPEDDPDRQNWELSDPNLDSFWRAAEEFDCAVFVHPWDMMGSREVKKYWLPWLVGMPAETSRAICHVLFSALLDKYPKLRICFAHGGGSFPYTIGRVDHGFTCRPDICAQDARRRPSSYVTKPAPKEMCRRCELDTVELRCTECRENLCHGCDQLLHARGSSRSHHRAPYVATPKRLTQFWVDSLVHDSRALDFVVSVIGEDRVVLGSDYPFPLGEWHPGRAIATHNFQSFETKQKLLNRNACEFLRIDLKDFVDIDADGLRLRPLSIIDERPASELLADVRSSEPPAAAPTSPGAPPPPIPVK